MGNDIGESFVLSEGFNDHLDEKEDLASEIAEMNEYFALEAMNGLIKNRIDATKETIKKYPFLREFMNNNGCKFASEGIKGEIITATGCMNYHSWEHWGTRFFILNDDGKNIIKVPGKVRGNLNYFPDNAGNCEPKIVGELIDDFSQYVIKFTDDADSNEAIMEIVSLK